MEFSEQANAMGADARWLSVDWKPVKKTIANSIPVTKLEANKSKSITVFLYFDDQGPVKEVSFGADPSSTIDGKDLESIEVNIAGKVRGTIKNDAFKGTNYISLGGAYPMSVLLQIRDQ